MTRILVTGARGYIGGAIAHRLAQSGHSVTGGIRHAAPLPPGVIPLITGDLADARLDLAGMEAVVHAAGLGHRRGLPPQIWRRANVDAAVNAATQAKAAGVRRFVLISTAHVHGRIAEGIVTDHSPANPMDFYAASKLEAEGEVAAAFGAGLNIIRPVAVIGPDCPGNLQLLMKLLRRGVPLPFGAIQNQRSFIDVQDLAQLVLALLESATPPDIVLAASPEAITTPALIGALAEGMGVQARLAPVPNAVLAAAAAILHRKPMWQSLGGSFIANPLAAQLLGWSPRQSLRQSLIETARRNALT